MKNIWLDDLESADSKLSAPIRWSEFDETCDNRVRQIEFRFLNPRLLAELGNIFADNPNQFVYPSPFFDRAKFVKANANRDLQDAEKQVLRKYLELYSPLLKDDFKNMAQGILDDVDEFGQTALHFAAEIKDPDLVEKLLQLGVSVNVPNYRGQVALHNACYFSGDMSKMDVVVDKLLQAQPFNAIDCQLHTPLYLACAFGQESTMRKLISAGSDIHASPDNLYPLELLRVNKLFENEPLWKAEKLRHELELAASDARHNYDPRYGRSLSVYNNYNGSQRNAPCL